MHAMHWLKILRIAETLENIKRRLVFVPHPAPMGVKFGTEEGTKVLHSDLKAILRLYLCN